MHAIRPGPASRRASSSSSTSKLLTPQRADLPLLDQLLERAPSSPRAGAGRASAAGRRRAGRSAGGAARLAGARSCPARLALCGSTLLTMNSSSRAARDRLADQLLGAPRRRARRCRRASGRRRCRRAARATSWPRRPLTHLPRPLPHDGHQLGQRTEGTAQRFRGRRHGAENNKPSTPGTRGVPLSLRRARHYIRSPWPSRASTRRRGKVGALRAARRARSGEAGRGRARVRELGRRPVAERAAVLRARRRDARRRGATRSARMMTRRWARRIGAAVEEARSAPRGCRYYAEHAEAFLRREPVADTRRRPRRASASSRWARCWR